MLRTEKCFRTWENKNKSKTAGVEMLQGCRAAFKPEAGENLTNSNTPGSQTDGL